MQDKILLGTESVESYFSTRYLYLLEDGTPVSARNVPHQDRIWEQKLLQWVDRPELQVGPDYPTVRHVTNVCVARASLLADLLLASYFQRRRALWNTLEVILRTHRRSLLAFNKFKDKYVHPLEAEFVDNIVVALPDSELNFADSSLHGPARHAAARARFVMRVANACQTREE
jgi:hypothetical protein